MNASPHFAQTYAEARDKFLAAGADRGARMCRDVQSSERGVQGEERSSETISQFSKLAETEPDAGDYAAALDRFLAALKLGRVHLLGHSLGTLIAARFAASSGVARLRVGSLWLFRKAKSWKYSFCEMGSYL